MDRMGLTPITLTEGSDAVGSVTGPSAARSAWRARLTRTGGRPPRIKARDLSLFLRELSDLLASGMTLGQALGTLRNRSLPVGTQTILDDLYRRVLQGESLSAACAAHPTTFSGLIVNLIRSGEASGRMSEVLERICSHQEMMQQTREKVLMALIYPGIVITMGLLTMVFTMTFIVPRFTAVLTELGSALPLPTRILVGTSRGLVRYGWALALAIGAGVTLLRRSIRTPAGRLKWDAFRLRVPVVKHVLMAHAFAQFARTLGSLLGNGVPVLDALRIVESTVGNEVIAREIREARNRVTDGSTISGPLAKSRVFPPLLTDMLAIGEQSGDMSGALIHIARRYESELDRSVKVFTTVLEPLLILLMAILIGFVALSMLLPVFNLTSGLSV
jgi:type II secretory pathway component PulF